MKKELSEYAFLDDKIKDLEAKLGFNSNSKQIQKEMNKYGMGELYLVDDDIEKKAREIRNEKKDPKQV